MQTYLYSIPHVAKEKYEDIWKMLDIHVGDRIWLIGELGMWKTTFVQEYIKHIFGDYIRSPTYTYYNVYDLPHATLYHFDLYRIDDTETFTLIGGEEILENDDNICIFEWPERLPASYYPTKQVTFSPGSIEDTRNIEIVSLEPLSSFTHFN